MLPPLRDATYMRRRLRSMLIACYAAYATEIYGCRALPSMLTLLLYAITLTLPAAAYYYAIAATRRAFIAP